MDKIYVPPSPFRLIPEHLRHLYAPQHLIPIQKPLPLAGRAALAPRRR